MISEGQVQPQKANLQQATTQQQTIVEPQVQVQQQQQQLQIRSYMKTSSFLCSQKKQATQFCSNKLCTQKNPYICNNFRCNCQFKHNICLRGRIQYVLSIIYLQIQQTQKIKLQIEDIVNKAIDQLSELKEKFISQVDLKIKYSHLSELEKQFFQINQDKRVPLQFNSSIFSELWQTINLKNNPQNRVNVQAIEHLKILNAKTKQSIQETQRQVDDTIIKKYGQQHSVYQQKRKFVQKQKFYANRIELIKFQTLYVRSSILDTIESIQRLFNLFPDKIQSFKRIYKASEQYFSISRFYDYNGSQKNILIICKTEKDKVIGGFSPHEFGPKLNNKNPNYHYYYDSVQYLEQNVLDQNNKTFIFSITNNDKFVLKPNTKCSIIRQPKKQCIKFGNNQLTIGNQANQYSTSMTELNMDSFQNPKYSSNQESFQKFNGNKQSKFKVKQWQAWKVQFYQ